MPTTRRTGDAETDALLDAMAAASARIVAAFPDRPILEAYVCQQSNGAFCAYAGKATRMRRIPGRGQPTADAAAEAAIAYLRAQD